MTENEARQVIECIEEKLNDNSLVFYTKVEQKALDMAIQALEEIQQYRAIGTVEDIEKSMQNVSVLLAEHEILKLYQAIGTIEEFKALKECFGHSTPKSRGKAIYDKAIDDFSEKLFGRLEEYKKQWMDEDYLDGIDEIIKIAKELADKMKGGAE